MKQRKYNYRRRLPHIQKDKLIFATFTTQQRWVLPPNARDEVLRCCKKAHGLTAYVLAFVVMPDHVHILFSALRDAEGWPFALPQIFGRLKSAAAHAVNQVLGRSGRVWQEESFEHVCRSYESEESVIEYIRQNPVVAGLVKRPEDYPWLYVEGEEPS